MTTIRLTLLRWRFAFQDHVLDRLPKRRLSWDTKVDAKAARKAGWRIDGDWWWYRQTRPDDAITGFLGSEHGFFGDDGRVYVRSAAITRWFDGFGCV